MNHSISLALAATAMTSHAMATESPRELNIRHDDIVEMPLNAQRFSRLIQAEGIPTDADAYTQAMRDMGLLPSCVILAHPALLSTQTRA